MESYKSTLVDFLKNCDTFFCWDTETTGLKPVVCDIIEFSAIKFVKRNNGKIDMVDSMDIFINPGYSIPANITELTGITNEDIKDAPDNKQAAEMIKAFLGDSPNMLGYNSVSFDEPFLDALYKKAQLGSFTPARHLDVLKMVKEKLPAPHKLINAVDNLGISDQFTFHRSVDDVKATAAVFREVTALYFKAPNYENSDNINITALNYWQKNDLQRLYVQTSIPDLKIYYDIVNDELIGCPPYNPSEIEKKIITFANTATIKEAAQKYIR